ncbi:sugar transferase [Qipengyuania sp. XHP0211]|uniref:sugar transferase n=1 Tax=Qipengyuania sp. XHP0211 TaxID=3038079 RepID=UPI00241D6469|nr:sugar transferase [Qipengyuania sp. XHP0211]MDG5750973.1 sugar transferase [Qipengyuania sp. XHP0211]
MTNLATDLVGCAASFFVVGWIYFDQARVEFILNHVLIFLTLFSVLAIYSAAYSIKALTDLGYSVRSISLAAVSSSAILIFITFYTKASADISRLLVTAGTLVAIAYLIGARYVSHRWIIPRYLPEIDGVVIIYDGGPEIQSDGTALLELDAEDLGVSPYDPMSLDRLGSSIYGADRVIVSCPVEKRSEWASILRASGVEGEIVSGSLSELRPIGLRHVGNLVSLVVSSRPLGFRARFTKRAMDVGFASVGLVLLSPVFLIVALAIKLEDGGPIFFKQRRMGRTNRFIDVLKFRSMSVEKLDSDGNRSASKDDDRITRVGRFIRRTSIDELPQLINVLRGDMSLVGPRPHALGSTAGKRLFWEIESEYWHRHSLRPGLTGLAQIRGLRGATDEEHQLSSRLNADLEYIANWSALGDLWIILMTAKVLVHDRAF